MTIKKATEKVIKAASKVSKTQLSKLTKWDEAFEILADGLTFDVIKQGPVTVVTVYREPGAKEDKIETFEFSNDAAWMDKEMDWDWNFLYRELCGLLMMNRKTWLKKPGRKKRT